VLEIVGGRPQTMLAYMFGAAMIALMMVLLVGVVPLRAQNAMSSAAPQLSVVMPLYNEGAHITPNVEQTLSALRMLGPFEIILVNDGSSDNSGEEIARLAENYSGEVVSLHLPRSGKGEALRQGAQAARGDYVVFLDADLDIPPEQILFFVAIQRVKKADAVIGSKMHPDSTVDYPLIRRIYSLGYYVLVKALFGLRVRDTQTGLKLVRRDLLLTGAGENGEPRVHARSRAAGAAGATRRGDGGSAGRRRVQDEVRRHRPAGGLADFSRYVAGVAKHPKLRFRIVDCRGLEEGAQKIVPREKSGVE
jgi:hypothetical protein